MAEAKPIDVIEGRARWCVVEGEALELLASLPGGCADAIVTDPPYSSGGAFRGDRTKSTDAKYTQTEQQGRRPDFAGDTRDQRSWAYWCALWLSECLRLAKPDARLVAFSDWRQLPTLTDAVQAGGWVWRGIVPCTNDRRNAPVNAAYCAGTKLKVAREYYAPFVRILTDNIKNGTVLYHSQIFNLESFIDRPGESITVINK
jgi:DNA modification methylase